MKLQKNDVLTIQIITEKLCEIGKVSHGNTRCETDYPLSIQNLSDIMDKIRSIHAEERGDIDKSTLGSIVDMYKCLRDSGFIDKYLDLSFTIRSGGAIPDDPIDSCLHHLNTLRLLSYSEKYEYLREMNVRLNRINFIRSICKDKGIEDGDNIRYGSFGTVLYTMEGAYTTQFEFYMEDQEEEEINN